MEDNMQMVGGILGDLKSMAIDMGGEIEKQNQQLDRVNAKVYFLFYLFIRSRNLNEESGLGGFILFGIYNISGLVALCLIFNTLSNWIT